MVIHRGCNAARRYNLLGRNKSMQVNESRILSTVFRPPFSFRYPLGNLPLSPVFAYAFFPQLDLSCSLQEGKEEKKQERDKAKREAEIFMCTDRVEFSPSSFSLESFASSRNLSNGKRGLRGGRGVETREEIDASLIFSSTVKRMIMAASSSEIFWSGCLSQRMLIKLAGTLRQVILVFV